ncbi:uncharacterized protein LOC131301130 isoform X2 [Rhododendron vialii]|uniref:uncharacterized protein LOC131301130 isoform X2 n=2 Tax=Rhododendron vialii TaxID=182163 RepID=UPI00265D79AA|nr:uncharacterized protein LOC131301130 isoform X2 [Rhododendron vialii]
MCCVRGYLAFVSYCVGDRDGRLELCCIRSRFLQLASHEFVNDTMFDPIIIVAIITGITTVWKAYLDLISQNKIKVIEIHHLVQYHNHCERQRQTKGYEVRDFYHGIPRQSERQVPAIVRQPQPQQQVAGTTTATAGTPTATAATMQQLATTTTDRALLNATMQYHDHCEMQSQMQTKGHEVRHFYHGVTRQLEQHVAAVVRQPQPQRQVVGHCHCTTTATAGRCLCTTTATATTMQQLATTTTDRPLENATMQYHDYCEKRQTKGHEVRHFHHGVPQQSERQVTTVVRQPQHQRQVTGRCRYTTTATAGMPTTMVATMQQLATTIIDRPLGTTTMQYHDHYERQTKGHEVGHFHHGVPRQPQRQVAAVVRQPQSQRQVAAVVRQPQRQQRCNN